MTTQTCFKPSIQVGNNGFRFWFLVRSLDMRKTIRIFAVLFTVLVLSSCSLFDRIQAYQREEFDRYMEERSRILQSRLPEGMSFEYVPLSNVLEQISKACGLEIKPWKDEGDREVTIDLSGMTVDDALNAVVLHVGGEGAVLIRQEYFLHQSWGQYWLWGYPPQRG
jgi:hypothetical protein